MSFREDFLAGTPSCDQEVHIVELSTQDVLEQADALPFWSQDYTQLGKGTFSGGISSTSYQGMQIFRETMNRAVDEFASAPADSYVIGLPTIADSDSSWGLLPVRENSLITLDKNAELLFRTANLSEITVAVIPAERLEAYASQVEYIDLRKLLETIKPVESLSTSATNRLLASLTGGMRYLADVRSTEHDLHMWQHFEDDLLSTCLQALLLTRENPRQHYDHRIHRYIVNRVRDLTLSNFGCPLTISELCIELRVSRRTLNHAFARVLGITPVTYMRNVRLHRVRAELQFSPQQITSIANVAAKWGFWHMSLFSRYYRELFGECPNETLLRSRVR
ncbi:transcriptional regulator, AraC family [Methylobacillus rhizosphaerae]|uniref:Transcriptional regulator, AraC family n=1 Tax=Methylobacillus rhizosphaerae TaxID=551994 RepID=A0A238Z990_9PROT|nr:helix-turn-helix domain-containing protein [Methylobacillus rhizosphaerae]SNR79619.1 transcriptional regulator, AraC family [Methylobacillus rhizosphaerae]